MLASFAGVAQKSAPQRPNIIYILADDMGYGDVKYLNPQGKIATPNIDRIGKEGTVLTDVHSSSAVCTPSRYSILTGRYAWRTKLKSGVLNGSSAPLIAPERLTVASLLQQNGYATACIGKWHLGLDWAMKKTDTGTLTVDYAKPFRGGPVERGFDYFFGIAASLDMPPFIYLENNACVGLPTVKKKYGREGPAEKDFEAENCVGDFTAKAVSFIKQQATGKKPFFLYFPMPSPHTPIVPTNRFKGKSGVMEYGDYVQETDWSVGELLKALEESGQAKNTLVIFTSDNGFAPYVLPKMNVESLGHYPSMDFRGYKSDIWEGGHRIPFLASWPGKIKAGTTNASTVCLSDFMATVSAIIGKPLPDNAGEDSYNILPYLTGNTSKPIREATVHHSINGYFAIREGNWKLILCPGSGGWEKPKNDEAFKAGMPPVQLYNLASDIKEEHNVQDKYPEVVQRLTLLMEKYVNDGRSTPGKKQANDDNVDLWKKNFMTAPASGG
ncbi:Arylsulfatase A [Sediminibacterium ginsengisoli]|uniref:Arylsulfatase A n=2 Tax=Sediminibacterium ginsengisoli TaxID=413434 RepID=A0A1T4M960_9BACT|nr:Arylsulfatase A [Sediminibacterium ginsengisoli]